MASKNISIREDLYEKLEKLKNKDESFSDLIERLISGGLKGSIPCLMKHFGAWEKLPEDFEQIIKDFRDSLNEEIDSKIKEIQDDLSG